MICNLELRIELDANEMHKNKDISEYILQKTQRMYNGKCYNAMYIISIEKIESEGPIEIVSFNLSANGRVCVVVSAKYMQYGMHDIALGCVVTNIDERGTLLCANDHLNAKVKVKNQIYKKGRAIPIIIKKCLYSLFQEKISAYAYDFTPIDRPVNYFIISNDSERKLYYFNETDALEKELEELTLDKKSIRKEFDKMFLGSRSAEKLKPAGSIRDFKLDQEYVLVLSAVPSTDSNYYVTAGASIDYPEISFLDAHKMLVKNYNKSLYNTIRFLQYYDKEKFEQDRDIWSQYISKT